MRPLDKRGQLKANLLSFRTKHCHIMPQTGKPKIGVRELLGPSLHHHLCFLQSSEDESSVATELCPSTDTVTVCTPQLAGLLLLCHEESVCEIRGGGAKSC